MTTSTANTDIPAPISGSDTVYKFTVGPEDLEIVKATIPAVAQAGTSFTQHFYKRMFKQHPELLNLFNQTNQKKPDGQPKKLLSTIVVAAQAAIEVGELPGEAIEEISQKHCALGLPASAYDIVGENLLAAIKELLTDDENVLKAWGNLYGDIAKVFITREQQIYDAMEKIPNAWLGKRSFRLESHEDISEGIARLKFVPVDGKPTPTVRPGQYLTIWVDVPETEGVYATYKMQPRHYTIALPREGEERNDSLSISVKKQGLVSTILFESKVGTTFDLSAPVGCFDLSGVEKLWLSDIDAPVVFLSGGVGITPVLAMLQNIFETHPTTWLHASECGSVHAYRDRVRSMAAVRKGDLTRRVWYENPREEDGEPDSSDNQAKYHFKGRMDLRKQQAELPSHALHLDNANTQYYMCGPPPFMNAQKAALKELGVGEDRIHWEGF